MDKGKVDGSAGTSSGPRQAKELASTPTCRGGDQTNHTDPGNDS